jgi:hypothetical protein
LQLFSVSVHEARRWLRLSISRFQTKEVQSVECTSGHMFLTLNWFSLRAN